MLPIQRRIELITFASANQSYIIEDDYDSEFRYTTPPVCSLFELDPEHVIYLGTFSKNLSPALRLGYMIVPPELIETCKQVKQFMDLHSPSLSQLALANFIDNGELDTHIRKMNKIYRKKNRFLRDRLEAFFPNIKLFGTSTGLHITSDFPNEIDEHLINQLKKEDVILYPVRNYVREGSHHKYKWIMGYGHLSSREIHIGVERLAKVFK